MRSPGGRVCAQAIKTAIALAALRFRRCAAVCTPDVLQRYAAGGYPKKLDVSVYWYGPHDQVERATGAASPFYDPTKQTVIYFHGWTGHPPGWTVQCGRITSKCDKRLCPDENSLADRWLRDGWNFGYLYWDQIADEECTRDAEQKIWYATVKNRGEGLAWRSYDIASNTYTTYHVQNKSTTAADLAASAVAAAMPNYRGHRVRFVGHSLGAQLAVRVADLLHLDKHPATPQRLALLEPFFTTIHLDLFRCGQVDPNPKVGDYLPQATASIVKRLWNLAAVTTEVYKSSVLTDMPLLGDPDRQLETLSALITYVPDWCGGLGPVHSEWLDQFGNLECKHLSVYPIYFLQYGNAPPEMVDGKPVLSTCPVPSSVCSDTDLQELVARQRRVGGQQEWTQKAGRDSMDPRDDTFTLLGPDSSTERAVVVSTTTFVVPAPAPLPTGTGQARIWVSTTMRPFVAVTSTTMVLSTQSRESPIALGTAGMALCLIAGVGYWMQQKQQRGVLKYNSFTESSGSDEEYSPSGATPFSEISPYSPVRTN